MSTQNRGETRSYEDGSANTKIRQFPGGSRFESEEKVDIFRPLANTAIRKKISDAFGTYLGKFLKFDTPYQGRQLPGGGDFTLNFLGKNQKSLLLSAQKKKTDGDHNLASTCAANAPTFQLTAPAVGNSPPPLRLRPSSCPPPLANSGPSTTFSRAKAQSRATNS